MRITDNGTVRGMVRITFNDAVKDMVRITVKDMGRGDIVTTYFTRVLGYNSYVFCLRTEDV